MNIASINLNLLVALDVLLQEQSVTRAAERLYVGQPAMTATLNQLRSLFEDPLLVRSGRGLKTTSLAESLRQPLSAILDDIQHLFDTTKVFDPRTSDRVFTLTASDYIAIVLLRPLLEHLAKIAPHVRIHVRPAEIDIFDDLARGLSDLVIYPESLLPLNHPFHKESLFSDEFVCIVSADHPEVDEKLTKEQLEELPFLSANLGILRSAATERLENQGYRFNTVMTSQSFVTAPLLLPGTKMYTITQRRLTANFPGSERNRVVGADLPLPKIEETMLWLPRAEADPGLAWLRSVIIEIARSLDDDASQEVDSAHQLD